MGRAGAAVSWALRPGRKVFGPTDGSVGCRPTAVIHHRRFRFCHQDISIERGAFSRLAMFRRSVTPAPHGTGGWQTAGRQVSQRKKRDLPTYTRRICSNAFRARIGIRKIWPPHPASLPPMRFLLVGSVICRERNRLQDAFGYHLAVDTIALGWMFPLPGQQRTFTAKSSSHHHLNSNSASQGAAGDAWRTTKKGGLSPSFFHKMWS